MDGWYTTTNIKTLFVGGPVYVKLSTIADGRHYYEKRLSQERFEMPAPKIWHRYTEQNLNILHRLLGRIISVKDPWHMTALNSVNNPIFPQLNFCTASTVLTYYQKF